MRSIIVSALLGLLLAGAAGEVKSMTNETNNTETATFGGGCFWCVEAIFEELRGVSQVRSGYAGGSGATSYKEVCSGESGHAEVVQVTFNPDELAFRDLLQVFFAVHDPTTLNRQGADVGSQYRSVVFYHDSGQRAVAKALIAELDMEKAYRNPIVTEVSPFDTFYVAEDYHQDYYANNKAQGYCQAVISPKLAKFREQFADKRK